MTTTIDETVAATCVAVELPVELITRLNTLADVFAADAHRQPQSTSALVTAAVEMLFDSLAGDGYGAHRFKHPSTAAMHILSGSPTNPLPTPNNRKEKQ